MSEKEIEEGIDLAVRMENDGIAFYGKAASRVKSPAGRLMFQSLARDERNHLKVLQEIAGELFHWDLSRAFAGDPKSRMKTVFEEDKAFLEERLAADPSDLEALELALRMEDEGYRLYSRIEGLYGDGAEKALYARLASEELQHYEMLQNAQTYLTDTGNWFIYEEHALMDGG